MVNKEKYLVHYLYGINIMHIIICFAVMLLRKYSLLDTVYVKYIVLGITLFMWLLFSSLAALGTRIQNGGYGLLFGFLAISPIAIITLFCFGLSFFEGLAWFKFFFIGSTVNFYFRPFVAIFNFIGFSAYVYYALCMLLLALVSYIGFLLGSNANKDKDRSKKNKKRLDKASKSKERKETKKAEKSEKISKEKPKKKTDEASIKELESMSKSAELIEDEEDDNELLSAELQQEIDRLKKELQEKKKHASN